MGEADTQLFGPEFVSGIFTRIVILFIRTVKVTRSTANSGGIVTQVVECLQLAMMLWSHGWERLSSNGHTL